MPMPERRIVDLDAAEEAAATTDIVVKQVAEELGVTVTKVLSFLGKSGSWNTRLTDDEVTRVRVHFGLTSPEGAASDDAASGSAPALPTPHRSLFEDAGQQEQAEELKARVEELASELGSRMRELEEQLEEKSSKIKELENKIHKQQRQIEELQGVSKEITLHEAVFDELSSFDKRRAGATEKERSDAARTMIERAVRLLKSKPEFSSEGKDSFQKAVKAAVGEVSDLQECLGDDEDVLEARVSRGYEKGIEGSESPPETESKKRTRFKEWVRKTVLEDE